MAHVPHAQHKHTHFYMVRILQIQLTKHKPSNYILRRRAGRVRPIAQIRYDRRRRRTHRAQQKQKRRCAHPVKHSRASNSSERDFATPLLYQYIKKRLNMNYYYYLSKKPRACVACALRLLLLLRGYVQTIELPLPPRTQRSVKVNVFWIDLTSRAPSSALKNIYIYKKLLTTDKVKKIVYV